MNVRTTYLPYALPMFDDAEINEVVDTLKSNWVSRGPKTEQFEKEFAGYVGVKHAIAMNSCTAALHTALAAKGIGPGDEVITTPLTFAATVNVIVHTGATPVFVDVDPDTFNINAGAIEAKINGNTRAIVPVHFAGRACDMDKILALGQKYGIFVLEDAAHALHTTYKGRMVGGIGDATAFSFYATKNLSTGEGGMLTTNDDELAEKARLISLHGMSRNAWNRYAKGGKWHYEILFPGFKYNMTDIQAAMGLRQLQKLEKMQKLREAYAKAYSTAFADMKELVIPGAEGDGRHAWHLYVIRLNEEQLTIGRNGFIEELTALNIGTSVHFIPVHLHPFYRDKYNYREGDYPAAEKIYRTEISLPLYPRMSEQDVEDVVHAVKHIVDKYKK